MRITLDDGRWLDMRPMYIDDMLQIQRAQEQLQSDGDHDRLAELAALCAVIDGGCEGKSWDGPTTMMTVEQAMRLARLWSDTTKDVVMPPLSGSDSGRPRPSRRSTGKARSSPRRSSGASSSAPDSGASPPGTS